MYQGIIQRIKYEEKKFVIQTPVKCSFLMDIRKISVDFYFIVPAQYKSLVIEKIRETWPRATIEDVDKIEEYSKDALYYQLCYKKEDALSLNVDRKNNDPLNSILSVIDIMEQDDRVGIFYNFMPGNQMAWRNKHRDTLEKVKQNMPIDKQKLSLGYIIMYLVDELMKVFTAILNIAGDFVGEGKNITQEVAVSTVGMTLYSRLSDSTIRKGDRNISDFFYRIRR
jgi:hypothetical protein